MRNDYKNFWCAALPDSKSVWLMESFASFTVLTPSRYNFNQDIRHLRAGEFIKLKKDLKLKGEYVEKCEDIRYEGEIGNWKFIEPPFFFIQASNKDQQTAVFIIDAGNTIEYLLGEKIAIEKLTLKNIIVWDEWK